MLCFELDDPFEFAEIRRKLVFQLLSLRIINKGEAEINREEIIKNIEKRYDELRTNISDILNDKEKYEKTLAEIRERKERNIATLSAYGIN